MRLVQEPGAQAEDEQEQPDELSEDDVRVEDDVQATCDVQEVAFAQAKPFEPLGFDGQGWCGEPQGQRLGVQENDARGQSVF